MLFHVVMQSLVLEMIAQTRIRPFDRRAPQGNATQGWYRLTFSTMLNQ
jgi:hypothetical protein